MARQKKTPTLVTAEIQTSTNLLSEKEEAFCQEFMLDFNKTRAAERAGFDNTNYGTLRVVAYKLFLKPEIQNRLAELRKERTSVLNITRETQLLELEELKEELKTVNNHKELIKVIEVQNKMLGLYEPLQIDVEGNLNINFSVQDEAIKNLIGNLKK